MHRVDARVRYARRQQFSRTGTTAAPSTSHRVEYRRVGSALDEIYSRLGSTERSEKQKRHRLKTKTIS